MGRPRKTATTPAASLSTRKRGRPRNQELPGLENRLLKPLENVATEYAEIRDERIALTEREVALKREALNLMRKYNKTVYRSNGVEIVVVPGEDSVRLKLAKGSHDDEHDDVRIVVEDEDALRAVEGALEDATTGE